MGSRDLPLRALILRTQVAIACLLQRLVHGQGNFAEIQANGCQLSCLVG
jgi:hypothetical protein